MAALGKMTSSARNKSSADVLDKHPDFFSQPDPSEHQPRLVKRDSASTLRNNRTYYNPPTKTKSRSTNATKQQSKTQEIIPDENKQKDDEQLALRLVEENQKISFEIYIYLICTVFDVLGKYRSRNKFLIIGKPCMIVLDTNFF
jgi:hypothetical protein